MSDEVAAAFSLSAQTAYSMARKADIKDGDNVLTTALISNTSLAIVERLKSCNANINIYGMPSKARSLRKYIKEWRFFLCSVSWYMGFRFVLSCLFCREGSFSMPSCQLTCIRTNCRTD